MTAESDSELCVRVDAGGARILYAKFIYNGLGTV